MYNRIKNLGIDLFIYIIDDCKYMYHPESFKSHQDYHSYQLIFKFEDWTHIINDGKEHMYIVAEYINAKNQILIKYQNECFDLLLVKLKGWCDSHRVVNVKV